jgi:hypothetical protein
VISDRKLQVLDGGMSLGGVTSSRNAVPRSGMAVSTLLRAFSFLSLLECRHVWVYIFFLFHLQGEQPIGIHFFRHLAVA